jgi:predicted CXXCH cytochrome family protein
MVATAPQLCLDCHAGIQKVIDQKVKHGAIADGASCMNCHNAHASNVENLLSALPFDQCVQCHSKDGMVDNAGVKITNMKKLLDQNKAHHAPVAAKDCSACHEPHGSENFRLLVAAYPSAFYAPFDVKSYELCFGCHNDQLVTLPETLTATRFRDGNRNLHFLHVNKSDNGRTCRACHEVHASSQNYQIRESVPYGPRAYKLKVNFVKNDNGGNCTQTCHPGRTYTNSTVPAKKGK